MEKLTDSFELANGYKIPCVGFGTWQTPNGETAVNVVKAAVEAGYRHIDTAAIYENEDGVGAGIKECGVARDQLFITSKVWNTERGYDKTMAAFDKTMSDLGLDYLDLYLIHWPANSKQFPDNWDALNLSTWKALTELYKAGRIKAIGVSNFKVHHLKSLMETEIKPMVNQIEFHPGFMQPEVVKFCKENNILVEAWAPLGTGRVLQNEQLLAIAAKYQRSVAQVCIRWCLQNGTLPLPKSVTPSRIVENSKVFDFALSAEDMAAINAMPEFGGSGLNSDVIDF